MLSPDINIPLSDSRASAEVIHPQVWHDLVDAFVDRARADYTDLSVLFADIDATKAVNDELGHHMGNLLIDTVDRVANVIPKTVRVRNNPGYPKRPLDVVTAHPSASPDPRALESAVPGLQLPEPQTLRVGGDEFGILLPFTDREGASVVAHRVREAVAEELKLPGNRQLAEIGAGVSVGVATLEPGMNASSLLSFADQALRVDKLKQLRALSSEQQTEFMAALDHLKNADVRPRDVPKYVELFGALALNEAFEDRDQSAQPEA